MEFEAKLKSRQGDAGIFEASGINWPEVNRKATGKVVLYIEERDKISDDQRKLLYALWRDYEAYTGTPLDAVEAWFKYQYMLHADLDHLPSLSRGRMSKHLATDFITYTLEYYLNNGIPFKQADWYKGADIERVCYAMLMKKVCFVCGREHSDIAHVEAVGAGRNRNTIDHSKHHFMCLCREHHQEQHTTGIRTFMSRHHIVPIKLKQGDIEKLMKGG